MRWYDTIRYYSIGIIDTAGHNFILHLPLPFFLQILLLSFLEFFCCYCCCWYVSESFSNKLNDPHVSENKSGIKVFPNLGRDAILVVPTVDDLRANTKPGTGYGHLLGFLRSASEEKVVLPVTIAVLEGKRNQKKKKERENKLHVSVPKDAISPWSISPKPIWRWKRSRVSWISIGRLTCICVQITNLWKQVGEKIAVEARKWHCGWEKSVAVHKWSRRSMVAREAGFKAQIWFLGRVPKKLEIGTWSRGPTAAIVVVEGERRAMFVIWLSEEQTSSLGLQQKPDGPIYIHICIFTCMPVCRSWIFGVRWVKQCSRG